MGRLGSLPLAAVALGASFYNVTGLSVGLGLLSALDTLASQAYGAQKHKQIIEAVYQSIFMMILLVLAVLPLWMVKKLPGQRDQF